MLVIWPLAEGFLMINYLEDRMVILLDPTVTVNLIVFIKQNWL
jgi:hypothetical protein